MAWRDPAWLLNGIASLSARPAAHEPSHQGGAYRSTINKFELRRPTPQTALDLFQGRWASDLSEVLPGVTSGATGHFKSDSRPTFILKHFAASGGTLNGMSVLDIGPLEGGHTYQLEQLGAAHIVAIEANSEAFLKCLIVKNALGMNRTEFLLGDILEYLRDTDRNFDLIFCSGVLYHMEDPVELIRLISRHTSRVFLWTHYYTEESRPGGLRLGAAVGYSANQASTPGSLSTANGKSYDVAGYGSWTGDRASLKVAIAYNFGQVRIDRTIPGISAATSGVEDQTVLQEFGDFGYKLGSAVPLEPFVSLAHIEASSGAFAESGGVAALSGAAKSSNETYSTLGIRAAFNLSGAFVPKFSVGWQHAFTSLAPGQIVTFQNAGTSFAVLGLPLASDAAAVQAGFDANLSPNAMISLSYDGSFAGRVENNALRGTFDWRF